MIHILWYLEEGESVTACTGDFKPRFWDYVGPDLRSEKRH